MSAQINLRFNSAFFKALLSLPFDMKDLESVDHEMYTSVQQILEMPPCAPTTEQAPCCFRKELCVCLLLSDAFAFESGLASFP